MSTLNTRDKRKLEKFLEMESGSVLDFSNRIFEEFVLEAVNIEIDSDKYTINGSSKAKKLRAFWNVESDYLVGRLLSALIEYVEETECKESRMEVDERDECYAIANRLLVGEPSLDDLKQTAKLSGSDHLATQIVRMEESLETDPTLAIGTAKELIETCCKTILIDRKIEFSESADIPTLTKATFKELDLVPEDAPKYPKGRDATKRLLSNLSTVAHCLAELRGLYGTGHGQHSSTIEIPVRHAKLAVGAASTLTRFLFETHEQTK